MNEPESQLSQSPLAKFAKKLAGPLSSLAVTGPALKLNRYFDAYLNFLIGKGAGTGWDLANEVEAAAGNLSAPNPVIFDVGANTGEWTRLMLARVPSARIVMFEPSQGCAAHLETILNDRTALVKSALGANPGTAHLWSSEETDGSASLHERRDSYFQDRQYASVEVPVTTIDAYMKEASIDSIDFLKLDVEGHELSVLQGASAALGEKKIRALAFEFGSANINSRTFFRDFWDELRSKGYELLRITPSGTLPVRAYSEELEYFRGVTNYIARI
jgi:FkbM family methyltransferase